MFIFGFDNHGGPFELFEESMIQPSPNKTRLVTESSSSLPSCIKNNVTNVLTLLGFYSHGCSWFLKGDFNFFPIAIGHTDEYYAAAYLRIDLMISFSYTAELTNELWVSCIKGTAILTRGCLEQIIYVLENSSSSRKPYST